MPASNEQPQNYGFFGKLYSGLMLSDSNKAFGLMMGMAVVMLFLGVVSLAPQVSKKFGQVSVKKQSQQSFAASQVPPCGNFGDVDGDGSVTAVDVLLIQRYIARLPTSVVFTDAVKLKADVDGNRQVDSVDVLLILNYVAGKNITFPMCVDHDGDGFVDGVENYIGTDPYKSCGTGAWPPDINNDKKVSLEDALAFGPVNNSFAGDSKYNKRFDLNADGKINSQDAGKLTASYNTACTLAPEPKINMQVLPQNTVLVGQTVTITWTSTNTIAPCDAVGSAPGWAGQKPTTNTAGINISSSNPILYDNLKLTCYGPGGQKPVTTTVNVLPPPCDSSNFTLSLVPASVKVGDPFKVTVTGMKNCDSHVVTFKMSTAASGWNVNLGTCVVSANSCSKDVVNQTNYGAGSYPVSAFLDLAPDGTIARQTQQTLTITVPPPVYSKPQGWPSTGEVGDAGVHTSCSSAGLCDDRSPYSNWQAVDIGTSGGDYDVRSTMDGKVTKVETSDSCGGTVDITNGTYVIHYCHLNPDPRKISVKWGDTVVYQQKIGEKSSSGLTYGYVHVHYAVSPGMTMDPPWVPFHPYAGNIINSLTDTNPGPGSSY